MYTRYLRITTVLCECYPSEGVGKINCTLTCWVVIFFEGFWRKLSTRSELFYSDKGVRLGKEVTEKLKKVVTLEKEVKEKLIRRGNSRKRETQK